ncbi:MAG: NUDIX hydrolase [Caulobacteraceae bacterium]
MISPTVPVDAATLMLVRDRGRLEVLMVQRHGGMRFGPGALVFPGGKLDAQDLDPAWGAHAAGWVQLDEQSRGLRLCAIRETFEETAILLGESKLGGQALDPMVAQALRDRLIAGEISFIETVKRLDLQLDLNALTPFARWITPAPQAIRFDAAFYVARAPDGQAAVCDGGETIAAEWLTPTEALALADVEARILMRPTRANLELLAASASVGSAIQAAQARTIVTVLQAD